MVSPEFDESLLNREDITRHPEPYRADLLAGARIVIVCTDDRRVNATVAADARAERALVNVADDPEHCDFYMPAVIEEYQKRRDVVYAALSETPGVRVRRPEGAFYVFPDVSFYFGKGSIDKRCLFKLF